MRSGRGNTVHSKPRHLPENHQNRTVRAQGTWETVDTLTGSHAGLTSVLVQGGARDRAPPQLEVLLLHHHLPRLRSGPGVLTPFWLGFWFWRVAVNSRALEHSGHFLQPSHLIDGSGKEENRHGGGEWSQPWDMKCPHGDLCKNGVGLKQY